MELLSDAQWSALKESFLARYPDFQNFASPGASFEEAELIGRRAILERFNKANLREVVPALLAEGQGFRAVDEIRRVGYGNMIDFRVWTSQFGVKDEQACTVLNGLLETVAQPYEGPHSLAPFFDAMEVAGVKADWDVSVLLWAFRPSDYFPIRIVTYRNFSASLGCPLVRKKRFSISQYGPVRDLMDAFGRRMEPWHPGDLTDVQSVFWDMAINDANSDEDDDVDSSLSSGEMLREEPVDEIDMEAEPPRRVWVFAPGANAVNWNNWLREQRVDIGWEIGDASQLVTKAAIRDAFIAEHGEGGSRKNSVMAVYEFAHVMHEGDIIFAKQGKTRLIGYGVVTSGYRYLADADLPHQRSVRWERTSQHDLPEEVSLPNKTLTQLSSHHGVYKWAMDLYGIEELESSSASEHEEYTRTDALKDLFMPEALLEKIVTQLQRRKNLILQGPPGVGKTYVARRLAYLIMGERDPSRVRMVQFHQSYSYEDFIQGFRPCEDGSFQLRNGHFYDFCMRARADKERDYFFIIDEINRGNLSKIFGELLMLLEHDKRGKEHALGLAYSNGEDGTGLFYVPENLYVIGTMNTADKSLALVDFAMRRRFAFMSLPPQFGQAYKNWLINECEAPAPFVNRLVQKLGTLNETITQDRQLGTGSCIGHSFFTPDPASPPPDWEGWLRDIVQAEIEPLLQEYWPDDAALAEEAVAALLQ